MKKCNLLHCKNFTGTIEELLAHVDNFDIREVKKTVNCDDDEPLPDEFHIDGIMESFGCSKQDAEKILAEIKLREVIRICDKMVISGDLEMRICEKTGEPLYKLSEQGKRILNSVNTTTTTTKKQK